jgi:hypothetical protein
MKRARIFIPIAIALMLACACSAEPSGNEACDAECEKAEKLRSCQLDLWTFPELPSLCTATFHEFGGGSFSDDPTPRFDSFESARCVMQALRDRTPGTVTIEHDRSPSIPGQSYTNTVIHVTESGIAVSEVHRGDDLSISHTLQPAQHLRDPVYFDACLGYDDPLEAFGCVSDWSAGCATEDVTEETAPRCW